jgi:hypothetical protein
VAPPRPHLPPPSPALRPGLPLPFPVAPGAPSHTKMPSSVSLLARAASRCSFPSRGRAIYSPLILPYSRRLYYKLKSIEFG